MFNGLRKMFLPRSKMISVVSMNDSYIQVQADIENTLGGNISVNPDRNRRKSKRMFVIDFVGDPMASGAHGLSREVTAIIAVAREDDEVLVKVESPGGAAYAYGYAASQIARLKEAGIHTTIAVDRVAASGGYMMACIGDKLISAPFAILGSIGVVAGIPNISKVLQNLDVDYRQYTAGKYKRTVSQMVPITEEGETKFIEDLEDTFTLFKDHVAKYRPQLDIEEVATGEHWYGTRAYNLGLVDEIKTSDDFILEKMKEREVLKVVYMADKTWSERVQGAAVAVLEKLVLRFASIYSYMRLG